MTGLELLEGLSYVDERYIAEAETARLGGGIPWMKLFSVAACVCILITSVYAYKLLQPKGATESMAAPEAAPAAAPEAAPEAAPLEPEYAVPESAEEQIIAAGELQQIPYARLRVTNVWEDGSFEAVVEEISDDPTLFEEGMQVTVVVDPAKVPDADAEVQNDLRTMHTDAQIEIKNGAYDAGVGTLYVSEVVFLCRDGH